MAASCSDGLCSIVRIEFALIIFPVWTSVPPCTSLSLTVLLLLVTLALCLMIVIEPKHF